MNGYVKYCSFVVWAVLAGSGLLLTNNAAKAEQVKAETVVTVAQDITPVADSAAVPVYFHFCHPRVYCGGWYCHPYYRCWHYYGRYFGCHPFRFWHW